MKQNITESSKTVQSSARSQWLWLFLAALHQPRLIRLYIIILYLGKGGERSFEPGPFSFILMQTGTNKPRIRQVLPHNKDSPASIPQNHFAEACSALCESLFSLLVDKLLSHRVISHPYKLDTAKQRILFFVYTIFQSNQPTYTRPKL